MIWLIFLEMVHNANNGDETTDQVEMAIGGQRNDKYNGEARQDCCRVDTFPTCR